MTYILYRDVSNPNSNESREWREIGRGDANEINRALTDDKKSPAGYNAGHRITDEATGSDAWEWWESEFSVETKMGRVAIPVC